MDQMTVEARRVEVPGGRRKNRTASSLADDTSFETRASSDFVQATVLTVRWLQAELVFTHGLEKASSFKIV